MLPLMLPAHVPFAAFVMKLPAPPVLCTVPPEPGTTPPLLVKVPANCVPAFRSSVAPKFTVSAWFCSSVLSAPETSVVMPPLSVVAPV